MVENHLDRYERLINVGFIKCVLPIFDFEKVEFNEKENLLQIQNIKENRIKRSDNM